MTLRVTIWNENRHEQENPEMRERYPGGIHGALAAYLSAQGHQVQTATLDQPHQGLPPEVLDSTQVLLWWGHRAHAEVPEALVERIQARVLEGMGAIFLHSSHFSRPFQRLMGTEGRLKWRNIGEKERLWVVDPGHPIAAGLPESFVIPHEEMYGEPFEIPAPDELVLVSWFAGGEVFRSGCCWRRGRGRVFYFRPGDERYPTYHQPEVLRVIGNAVTWAAPPANGPREVFGRRPTPPESLPG